eukprot:gene7369-8771_t
MYENRYDTFAIADGVQNSGGGCHVYQIRKSTCNEQEMTTDYAQQLAERYAGVIVRINPGCLQTAPPGVSRALQTVIKHMRLAKRVVWPDRTLLRHLDDKLSTYMFSRSETWGISDTYVHHDATACIESFRVSLGRTRSRVVKPIRGSCGEGVWVCVRCAINTSVPDDDESLFLMKISANDHIERRTFHEFVEYFLHGTQRTPRHASGRGGGHYKPPIDSTAAPTPFALEQRYLPRIQNGELRLVFVRDRLVETLLRTPAPRGSSTIGGVSRTRFVAECAPDDAVYREVAHHFQIYGLREMYRLLFDGIDSVVLPSLWCVDLIRDGDGAYKVCEFNCTCVGLLQFLAGCGPA